MICCNSFCVNQNSQSLFGEEKLDAVGRNGQAIARPELQGNGDIVGRYCAGWFGHRY